MEERVNMVNVTVIWRGNKYMVEMDSGANLKELGDKLQKLTDVKEDTMRLIVPQLSSKGSRMLHPFSDEHSCLSLQEASIFMLHPPASEALRRMHMLASDPGIVAIMNKHRWRVGIMTEMAPVGYVGVSPKCILGFNKNHGEEISLRLRTDDLKGFRKFESIKKTLLHELAHMVFSEHDSNFYALGKQVKLPLPTAVFVVAAAMEILLLIGFSEDVILDEIGKAETYLALKRSDPGLLWSSLETCIAY